MSIILVVYFCINTSVRKEKKLWQWMQGEKLRRHTG